MSQIVRHEQPDYEYRPQGLMAEDWGKAGPRTEPPEFVRRSILQQRRSMDDDESRDALMYVLSLDDAAVLEGRMKGQRGAPGDLPPAGRKHLGRRRRKGEPAVDHRPVRNRSVRSRPHRRARAGSDRGRMTEPEANSRASASTPNVAPDRRAPLDDRRSSRRA